MSRVVYLNALQALDAALRHGTLKAAAAELGITPAAIGQRIRTLEAFTGVPLLQRGQTGVAPTAVATGVAPALRRAFGDLDQVAMRLNLDRDGPVRFLCEASFLTFWLRPRLPALEVLLPGIKLAFLDEGDPGPPDLTLQFGGTGAVLLPDWLVPVSSPANLWRLGQSPDEAPLEGMPLLHVGPAPGLATERGWPDWIARFPLRRTGADRGFRYRHAADALNFAAASVGMALLPLALVVPALRAGTLVRLFPHLPLIPTLNDWTLHLSDRGQARANLRFVADWLRTEAAIYLGQLSNPLAGCDLQVELGSTPG